ncbi:MULTISPECIES: GPR1/FUN34/YaaH family transporter [unclassified Streptomyces]|uniref:GPR1/FUN34/YaaH family transporter n=1 Tax=unclassified Streptomyces TaxID=2593676 RepID=UPI00403CB7F3
MSEPQTRSSDLADAAPVALALFGFTLALYGVQYAGGVNVTVGLNYALLVSGVAEILCGVLCLVKGLAYPGYVLAVFGFWVIGLYFLLTSGVGAQGFTPDAIAGYVLLQVVPTLYLAIPAFAYRNVPFMVTFAAIAGLILSLGIGTIVGSDALTRASGWFAVLGAVAIWYAGAGAVLRNSGVISAEAGEGGTAAATGGPTQATLVDAG